MYAQFCNEHIKKLLAYHYKRLELRKFSFWLFRQILKLASELFTQRKDSNFKEYSLFQKTTQIWRMLEKKRIHIVEHKKK